MENRVVARYRSGPVIKGTTRNFFPSREKFNLITPDMKVFALKVADLKALFFVRSFLGDRTHNESRVFDNRSIPGRKLRCEFLDGEVLVGSSEGPSEPGQGFFLVPADSRSNNVKVFVVAASLRRVEPAG
jgi:hypothetical protein